MFGGHVDFDNINQDIEKILPIELMLLINISHFKNLHFNADIRLLLQNGKNVMPRVYIGVMSLIPHMFPI